MNCLYCGKELGTLQVLRGEEYCTPAHRKQYQERLGRAIHRIADNEPRAIRIAEFAEYWPTQIGFCEQISVLEFRHGPRGIQPYADFPVAISPLSSDGPAAADEPTAIEMENPLAAVTPGPLRVAATTSLPGFNHVSDTPGLAPALPMGQAFWPSTAPADRGSVRAVQLPSSELGPVGPAHFSATCDPAPKLETAATAALPSFVLEPLTGASGRPQYCEAPAELGSTAGAGRPPSRSAGNPAPHPAPVRAAALPEFALVPAEAPFAAIRTAAMEPAALCGICIPLPESEPAVWSVNHHSELQWRWPVAGMLYPAISAAAVRGTPNLPIESAFAHTPGAEPLEMRLTLAVCTTRVESRMKVKLPGGLPPALEAITVPLATAAAASEEEPQATNVTPATPAPRPAGIQLPPAERKIGAAAFRVAAPRDCPAEPVESLPRVQFAVSPRFAPFALHFPEFRLVEKTAGAALAEATPSQPAAAAPAATVSAAGLALLSGVPLTPPQPELRMTTTTAMPQAGLRPLEFFCKHINAEPVLGLGWMMPTPALREPRLLLSAETEIAEQRPAVPPHRAKNAVAEVFQMPVARKPLDWVREFAKPLAACFLIGAFLWAVAATVHVASHTAAVNRDVATLIRVEEGSSAAPNAAASGRAGEAAGAAAARPGLMARIRGAIASRAASQITETFHEGMGAWGAGIKGAPAGWLHNPEGYVRPVSFAMFRPSAGYRDYRMEFFGLIEQKGMSWAVRATDPKNYYAMKFKVVEPGLRPVVAIEHYPVVDGHKGHQTQTPLPELMFHNNTPYHVEVAVNGNRITTSVEGQEVDSWTDDTLSKGGVGFFADAGERARVYWVKVAKNEDFLGRICAYISGNSDSAAIAGLWPAPSGTPFAPRGGPADRADVALATIFAFGGSQQRRRSGHGAYDQHSE